jgi:hypothetical protein
MCEIPCIFPQNRQVPAETGSQMTASTATPKFLLILNFLASADTRQVTHSFEVFSASPSLAHLCAAHCKACFLLGRAAFSDPARGSPVVTLAGRPVLTPRRPEHRGGHRAWGWPEGE